MKAPARIVGVADAAVVLDGLPAMFKADVYARVMCQSPRTVRRQLAAGTCDVAPCLANPYRWRRIDVERYLSTITISAHRQARHRRRHLALAQ